MSQKIPEMEIVPAPPSPHYQKKATIAWVEYDPSTPLQLVQMWRSSLKKEPDVWIPVPVLKLENKIIT